MRNVDERYVDGTYESQNPGWHDSDARWKAEQVTALLERNGLEPSSFCDVGCGTGGVLRALSEVYGPQVRFAGFDVSDLVIEKARSLASSDIEFDLWGSTHERDAFDIALVLDVVEHVPDYLGFLAELKGISDSYVFHLPLDMNAQGVARRKPILEARKSVGHLHYFSKETALASLSYAGFEPTDWMYTASWRTVPDPTLGRRIFNRVRSGLFRKWPDKTVNALGGYSLLVLART